MIHTHAYTQNTNTQKVKQVFVSIKRQSFSVGSVGSALLRNTALLQAGLAVPSSARLHPAALCEHGKSKSLVKYDIHIQTHSAKNPCNQVIFMPH